MFQRKSYIILITILTIICLIPIWLCEYFPSRHGPGYLLMVEMLKQYFNPEYNYSDYYDLKMYPIPNLLFNFITYIFHLMFPILTSYKLSLSVNVILLPLSVFYFIKAVDPRKMFLGFVSFLYIYNFFFCLGHNHFCLSVPIFFFILGYWLRHEQHITLKHIILLNIATFLLYLCHIFGFILLLLVISIYSLLQYRSIKFMLSNIRLFIPGLICFIHYIVLNITQSSWCKLTFRYNPVHWTIEDFVMRFFYSFSKIEVLIVAAPMICVGYLIIANLIRHRSHLLRQPFVILTGVLCVLYMMLPWHAFEWHKVNVRMLPFIYVFLLVCTEPFKQELSNKMFLLIIVLSTMCLCVSMSHNMKKASSVVADYVSAIPKVERNKLLLPIMLEKEYTIGQMKPLTRAHDYYNIFKGGASGRSLAVSNTLVSFWYKHYPVKDIFPLFDTRQPDMEKMKQIYDYMLCWGRDNRIFELFKRNGFVLIHEQGKISMWVNSSRKR